MNLHEGPTYWDKTLEKIYDFKKVESNLKTKNLIIGGGMSGSLMLYILASEGKKVTVIDMDKIGKGSSTVNTGLLQYCSDKMLSEFAEEIGEEKAVLFYKMCLKSMDYLTKLQSDLLKEIDYRLRDSIYYASNKEDSKRLEIEYYWNVLFGGSKDGLPFIGKDPKNSNIYYLLGYEGNGTCYSTAGALIIKDLINGNPNIYEDLVKVNR